jgi:hypothetical protein
MLARLGNVIAWTGNAILILYLTGWAYAAYLGTADETGYIIAIPIVLICIAGHAIRYVLRGAE